MLTMFACPKPFAGLVGVIQRNAIRSWSLLTPQPEILLLGDADGTGALCQDLRLRHIPDVARNEYGTPLVDELFRRGEAEASHRVLCYVNADIILRSDFLAAIQRVLLHFSSGPILMVGRRWDLSMESEMEFGGDWQIELDRRLRRTGRRHGHTGIDYFVYRKGLWKEIPPFALGRTAWDSWLLFRAHSQGVPLVDLSYSVTAIHQEHGYEHHPQGSDGVWKGAEARHNLELAGGIGHLYTILDAPYCLTARGVRRRISPYVLYRTLVQLSGRYRIARALLHLIRFVREKPFHSVGLS